jgi:hypothetical protein
MNTGKRGVIAGAEARVRNAKIITSVRSPRNVNAPPESSRTFER